MFMPRYWVFVIGSVRPDRKVFESRKKFANLIKKNPYWGLSLRTPNIKKLEVGDRGVFYLAGSNGQKFIASFRIKSKAYPVSVEEKRN